MGGRFRALVVFFAGVVCAEGAGGGAEVPTSEEGMWDVVVESW